MKFLLLISMLPLVASAQNDPKLTKRLDQVFQSYFKNNEPGGAVLLVKDNTVIYQNAIGIADIKTAQPITTKTLFNIGSISKPFVSYGILKLAEEGKLSLDDEILKYFPDFLFPQIVKDVKIIHLLTHTSGLPDIRKVSEAHEFYLTARDEENWAPIKKTEKLEFDPGTRYRYSNPAFNALALIIEKVSGIKWQQYINQLIFKSADMTMSTITDGPHPETGVSHGYVKSKEGKFDELDYGEEPTFAAAGNGGVWSSVEELWKFEQAIQQQRFISAEVIKKSRTIYPFPSWSDSLGSRLGLSWFITREMNMAMIGHTGSQGGFISDYCWFPDKKVFYVLLCNIPKPIREIRTKILEEFWKQ